MKRSTKPGAPHAAASALLLTAACVAPSGGAADPDLPPVSPNRPTFSDGTGLIPLGHVQIESGYTHTHRRDYGSELRRDQLAELTLRGRVADAVELRLLWGGYAWQVNEPGERFEGGTDAGLAVLTPLTEQEGWKPALVLEAATTFGAGDEAFSSGHADPTLKLLWSYGGGVLPDWLGVGGNLIVNYPTEAGDRYTQPAASLWTTWSPVGTDTSVFAEWFWIGRPGDGVEPTQSVDAGIVQRVSPRVAVDARIGFGLDRRADDFFCGCGVTVLF